MSAASGRDLRVAIVGATGTVGARLVELLDEHRFPFAELKLFGAGEASVSAEEGEKEYAVDELHDARELARFDIAFLAAPAGCAGGIIAARPGPVLIDLSGAARGAPLVAPGMTPRERLAELAAGKVLAIAHPAAHALATILSALELRDRFVTATVILSASAGGRESLSALIEQSVDLMNAKMSVPEDQTQLAFNLFAPLRENEIVAQLATQVASLLGRTPALVIQVAQAPTLHGTALAICLPGAVADAAHVRESLRQAPGLLLAEHETLALRGVVDAVGQDAIVVRLYEQPAGLALWCLFDNARLAALSALWVAENLRAEGRATPA